MASQFSKSLGRDETANVSIADEPVRSEWPVVTWTRRHHSSAAAESTAQTARNSPSPSPHDLQCAYKCRSLKDASSAGLTLNRSWGSLHGHLSKSLVRDSTANASIADESVRSDLPVVCWIRRNHSSAAAESTAQTARNSPSPSPLLVCNVPTNADRLKMQTAHA